ncbi:MAG: hypothetical protein AAGI34_20310, partial [Pseudomonadota bacterium]
DLAAEVLPLQGGTPLLAEPVLLSEARQGAIQRQTAYLDGGTGLVATVALTEYSERREEIAFLDATPAARWRRRQMLYSLRGRQRAFLLRPAAGETARLVRLDSDTVEIALGSGYARTAANVVEVPA